MSQMLKSSGAMGMAVLSSRILGMVREQVYAAFLGDGPVAAAFKLAFSVPNLFRRLLGEGALSAAFIPIFKEKEKREGDAAVWRATNAVISGLLLAGTLIIAVVTALLTGLLAFGTFADAETVQSVLYRVNAPSWSELQLTLQLMRVMFPYMLLVCLAAIFMGILNARGYFFVPAMGTTILNLVMISAAVLSFKVVPRFAPDWAGTLSQQIFGLAIGVLLAGAAQAFYQIHALRQEGFRFQWVNPAGDETVRQVVRKMIPGMMGVAAFQVNVLLTSLVAFKVDRQIYASFDYAVRLMELPQGMFGISVATYLLPTLSALAVDKKYPEFRTTLRQAVSYLMFINLLASVLLFFLAEPIVRLIFEWGKFGPGATHRATLALTYLAPGLLVFSLVNIMARAFYALGDTQTPMKISIFCLVTNLVFTILLIHPLRQAGLGLANTASSTINLCLLTYALRIKLKRLELGELKKIALPQLTIVIAAGAVAWAGNRWWDQHLGHTNLLLRVGQVFVPATVAAIIYGALGWWLNIPSAREVITLMRSRLGRLSRGAKG